MYCPSCGSKLSREAAFCHKCGKKIPAELLEAENKNTAEALCEEDYDSLFTYSTDVPEKDYEAAIPEDGEIKEKLFSLGKLIKSDRVEEEIKGELNFDIPEDWDITEDIVLPGKRAEAPLPAGEIDLDIPDDWEAPKSEHAPKSKPTDDEFSESDLEFVFPAGIEESSNQQSDSQTSEGGSLTFDIPDDF